MKLDLLNRKWLEIVFEGRNKSYGAYQLRKENSKTLVRSLIIGGLVFGIAVATPVIADLIGNSSNNDEAELNKKIVTIKLPPKEEKPVENLPPPPPPPPKVDVVKFVKPVVAKKEDVTEDPPPQKMLEKKTVGDENIKGDPDAPATLGPVGDGPKDQEVTEDPNKLYSMAGIETKPDFPGGMAKFYKYIGEEFEPSSDSDFKGGKVFVSFVVEKDGSLTDIKVTRDVGYGSKEEAIRVLKKCRKWVPGEQNGKKVRVLYSLPITIQANAE